MTVLSQGHGLLLLVLLVPSLLNSVLGAEPVSWTYRCPCKCDFDKLGRKRVVCDDGARNSIPSPAMDPETQVFVFSAPADKENNVAIGRIFQEFERLEEVYITHSQVPAIGDASFWPGKRLYSLDLSHNRISVLREHDFFGLTNLGVLDLSDNSLSLPPSAAFHFLTNLTRLSLARNKLSKLVPRLFFKLARLEHLDLSGNPLTEIHPDDIKDVRALRTLHLVGCRLTRFHSLVYQGLPLLEELDLRENAFVHLASEEFKHTPNLKLLKLDGNKLTTLLDNTFFGHTLDVLGLSRNKIASIKSCAFCNASIKRLDISRNNLQHIQEGLLTPLKDSLTTLNAEENRDLVEGPRSIRNLISPLTRLKVLSVASTNLDDTIPDYMFSSQSDSLTSLDLSGNKFVNVSAKWLLPLRKLEELDLSSNQMYGLSKLVVDSLDNITTLNTLWLQENPWSCYRCHILDLHDWISKSRPAYVKTCQFGSGFCVKCATPSDLVGREVHTLNELHLEWCADPSVQLRLSASEPRVGLVLAMLIIISLIIVIITVVIMYRKQGATYYTHEDERLDEKAVFSVEAAAAGLRKSLSPSAFASPPMSPPPVSASVGSMSPPLSPPHTSSSSLPPPPPPPLPPVAPRKGSSLTGHETRPKERMA